MSWLSEYLKLIPEGLKNADKLVEAVVNEIQMELGNLPQDEKEEIIRRRLICKACPFMSKNAVENPAMNYKTTRKDEHCMHCGCPIKTRTAALSKPCGIDSFNKKNPYQAMELKWDVYTKPTN